MFEINNKNSDVPVKVNLFIEGEFTPSISGEYFERVDPSTNIIASMAASGGVDDAGKIVRTAAANFEAWSGMKLSDRVEILIRVRDLLPSYRDQFAHCMVREIGSTESWIDFNIETAREAINAAIDLAMSHGKEFDSISSSENYVQRQAAGVCLAIAPWNAPLALGMRSIVFPLVFGNTVIFKASEISPATHLLLGELFSKAGLPKGVLGILSNAPENSEEVIRYLVSHPVVRRVNFTGSTRIGKVIASIASESLKRCLLELGGKSPMIILKDADIDLAVSEAIWGAYLNQGQICMATDRILVAEEVIEEFTHKLKAQASALISGDPRDPKIKLGPVISDQIANRLSSLIEDAVTKGAEMIIGNVPTNQFIDATLLTNITPMMRVYSEECFGPIACLYPFDSIEEAITIANNCDYGLSSSIFTKDIDTAKSIASQLEVGMCHINSSTVKDDPYMPFGGVKASGYGRFGSTASLDEFTDIKWITVNK